MKVRYTTAAHRDPSAALTFWHGVNPAVARRIEAEITREIRALARHTWIGRPGVDDTRELVISRAPYIAIYAVEGDEIIVRRIYHQRQNRPMPD